MATGGLSGTNNSYPAFIFWLRIGMDDQQQGDRANHSHSVPALLPVLKPARKYDVQRIIPNILCHVERNPVSGQIFPRLFRVPFKALGCIWLLRLS